MTPELDNAVQAIEAGREAPVYLLVGEEYLVRQAAERLLAALAPGGTADLNVVTMDAAGPREIAAELATLPMFGGRKVVYCRDPEFLAPKKGRVDALTRARDAWKANRQKDAARRVLALAARAGWTVEDLDPTKPGAPGKDQWASELEITLAAMDIEFLKEVQAFCRAEGVTAPSGDDSALTDWLAAAPARGQVLVLVATECEKKLPLVKAIEDRGELLDLKISRDLTKSFKKPDFKNRGGKDAEMLRDLARSTLAPFKKTIDDPALEALVERVGGNLRLVQSELTKLALHGEAAAILKKDVLALVAHVREDEYLELSDALQKRDLAAVLKYVADAESQKQHPLMLLGSFASVVRGLLTNHERLVALSGGQPPKNYNDFQSRLWPSIEAEAVGAKGKPPHPFGVFMGMQAAVAWGRQNLLSGLVACAEADLALKLGGEMRVVERLAWQLCGKAGPWESRMHTIRREKER